MHGNSSPFTKFCFENLSPLITKDKILFYEQNDIETIDYFTNHFQKIKFLESSAFHDEMEILDYSPIKKTYCLDTSDLISKSVLSEIKANKKRDSKFAISNFDDNFQFKINLSKQFVENSEEPAEINEKSASQDAEVVLPINEPIKEPTGIKCGCKRSQCLKLYCECFASGVTCGDGCGCLDCKNTDTNNDERCKIISNILEKNPSAFQGVDFSWLNKAKKPSVSKNFRGCNCKKSGCQKKYCECYTAGVGCSSFCSCTNCKNNEASTSDLKSKRRVILKLQDDEISPKQDEDKEKHADCEIEPAVRKFQIGNDFLRNDLVITQLRQELSLGLRPKINDLKVL